MMSEKWAQSVDYCEINTFCFTNAHLMMEGQKLKMSKRPQNITISAPKESFSGDGRR